MNLFKKFYLTFPCGRGGKLMSLREKAGKTGLVIVYIAAAGAAIFLILKYLLPAFAPFILSFFLAFLLQKPVGFLEKKLRVPRGLSSALLVLALLGLLCWGLATLFGALFRELAEFISGLTAGDAGYLSGLSALADKIGGFIDKVIGNIFPSAEGDVDTAGMMRSLLMSALSSVAATLSKWAAHIVSGAPKALVFFIVLVFSGIYFCADYPKIRAFASSKLSGKLKKYSLHIRKEGIVAAANYAKSYFAIFLMTFAELLLGFAVIRQKYALVLAFLIALVDIMPVLGVGTVLLPWTAGLLLIGNSMKAIQIGILYLVITVVRQIAEPRIVGSVTGLSPVVTLICMYSGLKLAGAAGMIFFPLAAALIIKLKQAFSHDTEAAGPTSGKKTAKGAAADEKSTN